MFASARHVRNLLLRASVVLVVTALSGCGDGDAPSEGTSSACGALVCDASADTACSHNVCDPVDGVCKMSARNDGLVCDDGDPCSLGDLCTDGACVTGKTDVCACRADADCGDDGDACNGTSTCDTKVFPYRCVTSAAVTCDAPDKPCHVATCDPKTGSCADSPAKDGTACDDGDACTAGDTCAAGSCVGKTDTCVCKQDSDCGDSDNNPCTGVSYCDTSGGGPGTCKLNPATVVTCSNKSDTACRKNTCLPSTGACELVPVKDDTSCDDGDACTDNDACVAGACVGGVDTCKCSQDSDCAKLEDGDQCNGTLYCNKASGACLVNPATVVVCPTAGDTDCAKNVCLPQTGQCKALPRAEVKLAGCVDVDLGGLIGKQCLWLPADATATGAIPCDDSNACTVGEVCQGKACAGGKVTCECDEDSDCANKDDGDLCNGTPFCDKSVGQCKPNPASVVYCSKAQDTACEKATCDPKSGACALQPVASAAACDDGEPCTVKDACDGKGACLGGGPNGCDDNDACTVDSCAKGAGCKHAAKGCDDGNACTVDACAAKTGQCTHTPRPKGYVCDADQSGCTVGDFCDGVVCKAGKDFACPPAQDACQQSVCVSSGATSAKCATVAKTNLTPCPDDAKACLLGARCLKGSCVAGETPRLFSATYGTDKVQGAYLDATGAPGGGLVAVGYEAVGKSDAARWLVTRLERDGSVRWQASYLGTAGQPALRQWAGAVAMASDGSAWVGGRVLDKGDKARARLVRFDDATGKVLGETTLSSTVEAWRVIAMEPLSVGGVVVSWSSPVGSTTLETVRHQRLSAALASVWVTDPYANVHTAGGANSLAVSGEIAVFASQNSKSYGQPWGYQVVRVTDGKMLLVSTSTAVANDDKAVGVAALTGGRAAVLHADPKGGPGAQFRTIRADGGRGFDEPRMTELSAPVGIVARGSTGALGIAGISAKGGYVASLNRVGALQWRRDFTEALPHGLHAVAAVDGDLVAVGWRKGTAVATRPWIVRAGPYGHVSCGALGACAGRGWKDCDDATDCTADACDSVAGCTHAGKTATSCTPEDSCSAQGVCHLGQCKPSRWGRLLNMRQGFSTADGYKIDASTTGAVVEVDQGAVSLVGLTKPAGSDPLRSFRIDVDAKGAEVHPRSQALCSGLSTAGGMRALSAGEALVYGSGGGRARVCRLPLKAKAPSSVVVSACTSCKGEARDAAMRSDGSLVAVVQETSPALVRASRVDAKGTLSWNTALAALSQGHGVAARATGGAVVVGTGAAAKVGAVVGLSHTGAVVWTHLLKSQGTLSAVDLTPGGEAVAVGTLEDNAVTQRSVVVRLNEVTGKVRWTRVVTPADLSAARGVVATDDGGVAVAGDVVIDKAAHVYLERLDPAGKQVWRRNYRVRWVNDSLYPAVFGGLSRWSGGFAIATHTQGSYPALIRTDMSGHDRCDGSGTCVDHVTTTCDDQNPCTTDWCDPKGGCKHDAVTGCATCTSNAECKSSDPCVATSCQAGQCSATPVISVACCPKVQLSEDFDAGTTAKLVNSKGGSKGWHVVAKAAKASSGTSALHYGDPATGDYAFGGGGHNGTATWPAVKLPAGNPRLTLKLYLAVESSTTYDNLEVRLLRAGKKTEVLWSKGAGTTNKWLDLNFALGPWSGESVQLQLWFNTVDGISNKTLGVFVDDVRIAPPCP